MRQSKLLFQSTCSFLNKQKILKQTKKNYFLHHSAFYCQKTADGPKVLVTRKLIDPALQKIREAFPTVQLDVWPEEQTPIPRTVLLEKVSSGLDGLICMLSDKVDSELLKCCPKNKLRVVSTMSVGFNHIDLETCKRHKIKVGNTPDVLTETTADLVLGLTLATCRRFREAISSVEQGKWGSWSPYWLCGVDVHHSKVGIVGFGRIGQAVARRFLGFDCQILYNSRTEKAAGKKMGASFVDLDTLLRESDIVIPQCLLSEETRNMFHLEAFKKMKPTAIFINASRGEVVDQEALYQALKQGIIRGAGLDVCVPEPLPPSHPLLSLPNCTILPHIGSASTSTREKMSYMCVENLIAGLENQSLPYAV
ncbi:glyoxylate reductase/hydroxypyruvate reductase [Galdieria sulphuraria]|uniref:Glyoxylate reductase/hydroxypyruvate reductase n=1 Tax=Galdieria sulphuraria TaxID=130081 RepID=M2XWD2_GALSU|nr:glyoxylate reductase/hydroxypyruvate reductase [Galdieria sulphuraria]EME27744.1 glyoxylate reductase/hydroxypyruvate reductase [Galdieria sulphuraria]|eukprot:XP_005704264.1 glyoxylate reductase/hydroxypyruvate reductase [Galdieria sulphuraria]